jgi:FHA domain
MTDITRTTLPISFYDKLSTGTTTKAEILANLQKDTASLVSMRKDAAARVLVTVSATKPGLVWSAPQPRRNRIVDWLRERLGKTNADQPKVADAHARIALEEGSDSSEAGERLSHRPAAHGLLYDLAAAGRIDVLRIGRADSQDFRIEDRCVSREHGLALFVNGIVYYCDYGTFFTDDDAKKSRRLPGRHGSLNGTFIRDDTRIVDTLIRWNADDELGLAGSVKTSDGHRVSTIRMSHHWVNGWH